MFGREDTDMRSTLQIPFAAPTILVLLVGCSQTVTRPSPPDVRLSVTASPAVAQPSEPAAIELSVRNAGNATVWHCEGCGCGNGSAIAILGPDGIEVALTDPWGPYPACAEREDAVLEPGGALESRFVFDGTLFKRDSPTFPSPTYTALPGTYTVIARFKYSATSPKNQIGVERITLERRTTFIWRT